MNYDTVPLIMAVSDFQNTDALAKYANECNEPIFLTKDGRGDCVIMSMKAYERERMLLAYHTHKTMKLMK